MKLIDIVIVRFFFLSAPYQRSLAIVVIRKMKIRAKRKPGGLPGGSERGDEIEDELCSHEVRVLSSH